MRYTHVSFFGPGSFEDEKGGNEILEFFGWLSVWDVDEKRVQDIKEQMRKIAGAQSPQGSFTGWCKSLEIRALRWGI